MNERDIVKVLTAKIEQRTSLPTKQETAVFVVRLLAPDIAALIKSEVATARREWVKGLERQR